MNQIITHSNILNPYDLKVIKSTARHSDEIVKDLLIDEAYEVILSKNSIIQNEPFEIAEGDVINVMFIPKGGGGGGNKITRTIMMVVVAVASAWTGGAVGAAYGSIWGAVAAGGVSIVGGLLVNAILPVSTATNSLNSSDFSSSTTYSWDESYNKFTQGLPVPKVFGTHKITPPLISKFIETIDNKQYFNGLYALNDGVINSISDIKINDESIGNFDNVTYEVRYGYNDQLAVLNFDNTRYDKPVGRKLDTSYTVTETSGNGVISLTTTLLFPRGLFYANDSGAITNYSVKLAMEYSSDGINWSRFGGDTYTIGYWYYVNSAGVISKETNIHPYGTWIEYVPSLPSNAIYHSSEHNKYGTNYWYYEAWYSPYTTITDSTTSTLRKTFKVNNLPQAQYQVRARFYEAPESSSRYGSDCYLEYITEEIGDDFTYPSTALLSIKALATDQLSGSAPKVSCIVSANSSNPATISKQMLLESGYTADRLLPSLDAWEIHCNNKGYTFNGVFDTSMTLRKALDLVGTVGRASVVQFGSKFEAIMDRAEEIPVQCFTFGMGNILKDSFKQTFLPILDRANVIEVTYYDANLNYEPTIVEVSSGNYDSVSEENRTAITLVGCTNRALAIAHARYMLNCNRYLTETLEIEADKDSLVCKYGSIVKVSHDTPQYGFSGRIVSYTSTHIMLDREVTFESGKSYYIQIRDKHNNVKDHLVNNTNNTTDTLTFVSTVLDVYEKYDNYAFGEIGKASKLYRVLKISTSSDLTRKLTLLEYNEDVYNDSDDIDVPIISDFGLRNLRATDYIRYAKDGSIETVMQLAWVGQGLFYTVQYAQIGGSYKSVKAYDSVVDIIAEDVIYNIIVTDNFGNSITLTYTVQGKITPPDAITNLTCNESGNVFELAWSYAPPIDFKEFIIYLDNVEIGRTTAKSFQYKSAGLASKTFGVQCVDTTGNVSIVVPISLSAAIPSNITNLTCNESGNVFELAWSYTQDTDFKEFIIYLDNVEIGRTTAKSFQYKSTGLASKTFKIITLDTGNNASSGTSISKSASAPAAISSLSYTFDIRGVVLSWTKSIDSDFYRYEMRETNSNWGEDGYVYKGVDTTVALIPTSNKIYYLKSIDTGGNYGIVASIEITLPTPSLPSNITHKFTDTTSSMAEITLSWDNSSSQFGIDYYKVSYGTKTVNIKATEIKVIADWDGDRVFSITAYDSFGFTSAPAQKTITKAFPNAPLNFRFQVIDNNVLFYWDEPTITTLPITSYELRRGADWASAELIGKKSGGFTTVFESVGGTYTYWISSIDSDNRYSTPTSITCTVSQPPDFILNVSNVSTFNGTKNNMLLENGYLLANIDTAKTWEQHFTSLGWTTPQDQINAGYPIFIQPTFTAGYYEETVDLGTILASSRITVTLSAQTLAGVVSTSCSISVSIDGTNWTTYSNMFQVFATNFRYYKFKINVSATTATGLYKITNITSVLDSKLKNDGGTKACLSTDVGGTVVNFNMPFLDIASITVTPMGTTPITAIYDFTDTPNPTSFKILLFNQSGTRVSGTASWSIKGY